jgi:hypothetical protein
MPARQKLNSAYFAGSVLLAAVAGWGCSSWPVFCAALALLLISNLISGDIRPGHRR